MPEIVQEQNWYVVRCGEDAGLFQRLTRLPRKHLNVITRTCRVPVEDYRLLREAVGAEWPVSSTYDYTPKTPMFQHQRVGVDILLNEPTYLVADEQGTGKTKMLIDLMQILKLQGEVRRVLVVAKASLKYNWLEEIHRHSHEYAWVYEGSKAKRLRLLDAFVENGPQFLIVGWETMRGDIDALARVRWDAVILDEAHKAKDPFSGIGKAIHKLQAPRRYALTGTPIINRPEESYNLLKWLGRESRAYYSFMAAYFVKQGYLWIPRPHKMPELQSRIQATMLRRRKADILDLPPKTRQTIYVDLTPEQRRVYNQIRDELRIELADETKTISHILAKITYLKEVTNSVRLLGRQETDPSAKVKAIKDLVEDITEQGHKVIIFTQYKKFYDILRDELQTYHPACIAGDVASTAKRGEVLSARQQEARRFQEDPTCQVFIGVASACREGLTLTAASYVIFADKEWSPLYVEQAEDRAHRIGTTESVTIYSVVAKATIEEGIEALLREKKDVFTALVEGKRRDWRTVFLSLLDYE